MSIDLLCGLLHRSAGISIFILDKDFRVIWKNSEDECPLQHVPHAEGTYCYRMLRSRDGHCVLSCPPVSGGPGACQQYHEHADDREAVFHVTISARRDQSGDNAGYLIVQQDITQWKQRDEQRYQDANRQYLLHLAGGFAHEINNPLTVVSGMLQEYSQLSDLDEERRQDFRTMVRACNRIREFVNRIRALSAEESEDGSAADAATIFNRAAGYFQEFFRIKDIHIAWDLPDRWSNPSMSPGVLAKIVFNLLHYIADSIRPGGTIRIEVPPPNDHPYLQAVFSSDEFISLPHQLNNIFLSPGHPSELDAIHALGLTTVHNLVKGHHGNLRIEQKAPRGMAFYLEIPLR
jgi:signal transduction histidine kinase